MIKTLYTIGKALADNDEYADYFSPWSNPFPGANRAGTVLMVEIEDRQLVRISPEPFKRSYLNRYLFRELAGARATSLVPTLFFFNDDKEREISFEKFNDRLTRCLEANKAILHPLLDLPAFYKSFPGWFDLAAQEAPPKQNLLVTFSFDGNYVGEIPAFRDLLTDEAYTKYKRSKRAEFVGTNQVCAITYQRVPEVWGKVDTLGFTVDDEAFLRGGFELDDAHKMFPVSSEVVPILEGSRRIVLEKLSYNFYGMKYLIVPHFIESNEAVIQRVTEVFVEKSIQKPYLETQGQGLINNEAIIEEILNDRELHRQGVYYDLFFYQPNNAQFLIKLHLQDLMPSRFSRIAQTKIRVEERYRPLTQTLIPAKGKQSEQRFEYHLHFGHIKNYFSTTVQSKTVFHPYFFKILEAVFYGTDLNEEQILRAFMEKITDGFKQEAADKYAFERETKRSFAFYQYLFHLGLFSTKPQFPMPENPDPVALTLETFEAQHPELFAHPHRRAAFYTGCLVERLLGKQRSKLRNEPFRKYLHGMNVDRNELQKILLKWQQKASDYAQAGEFYPSELAEMDALQVLAMPALMESVTGKPVTKTQLSYDFSLGMVMQKSFTSELIRQRVAAKNAAKSTAE